MNDETRIDNTNPISPPPAEGGTPHPHAKQHIDRIHNELKACGVSRWGFMYQECSYLPLLLHYDEHIKGVVYGNSDNNRAMMVATDRRVIYLDKKPLFFKSDELTYNVVSGVSYGQIGYSGTLVLHTKMGDFKFKVLNKRCALGFKAYIDTRIENTVREASGYDSNPT